MPEPNISVSDQSKITIPLRNLIALVVFVAVLAASYFTITSRITFLEHNLSLIQLHVEQNNEFRIRWPRGELGALPDDAEQNMRLRQCEKQDEELKETVNGLTR